MPAYASGQPTLSARTIVASLETVSVETRRELPKTGCSSIENRGGGREVSDGSCARRADGWSYFIFRRELRTLLERGRERAVRVGGTSFFL
jgi:hypothetical protein